MELFSARLKWLREKRGFTQQQMAERLGISQSGYAKVEYNKRELNFEKLALLPEILGESTDFLLGVIHHDREVQKLIEEFHATLGEIANLVERLSKGTDYMESKDDPVMKEIAKQQYEYISKRIIDLRNEGNNLMYAYQEKCKEIPFAVPLKLKYDILENKEGQ